MNIQDPDDRTPIHYGAYNGHIDIVNTLLQANADINTQELDQYHDAIIHNITDDINIQNQDDSCILGKREK